MARSQAGQDSIQIPAHRKKVLIIEDDPDIRDSLAQILELEGYETISAANGREGLAQLSTSELPCVILLDLMMPVMSGWEFIAAQKENQQIKAIPVVVISAAGERAKNTSASAILKKPIDIPAMLAAIRSFCD